jgi:hypothetical protein
MYEGEWRPSAAGDFALEVTAGSLRGAAVAHVDPSTLHGTGADEKALAIVAAASGGRLVRDEAALVDALIAAFPARSVSRPVRPGRSPWWAALFAVLLCGEWLLRRRRGLA